jgi:hypothetical protein
MPASTQKVYVGKHLIQEIITVESEDGEAPQVEVIPGPEPKVKEAEPGMSRRLARGAAPARRTQP